MSEIDPSEPYALHVSWSAYDGLIESLAARIHRSGWAFDQIICLARGGLRPGDVLSRVFGKPLGVLSTSSYHDGSQQRGELSVADHISLSASHLHGRILLVDDLADSGTTLLAASQRLRNAPGVLEVRSAVLWHKHSSCVVPDFAACRLKGAPWIHQPFERYEGEDLEALVQRVVDAGDNLDDEYRG